MTRREIPALSCLDLGGSGNSEQEHDRNLRRYSSAKKATLSFIDSISSNLECFNQKYSRGSMTWGVSRIVEQVKSCGDFLWFHVFPGEIHRLAGGFTCKKSLWCVCCALRRSGRIAKTYLPIITQQLEQNADLVPVLITWTVKNRPDLDSCFQHIKQVQRGMLKRRRDSFDRPRLRRLSPLRYLHGGAGSYEFKRGADGGWNLHIHEIALIDRRDFVFTEELVPLKGRFNQEPEKYKRIYVPRELVSLLAQELWLHSGDSFIVDVRGLYPRELYSRLVSLPPEDLLKPVYQLSDTEDVCETACTPDSLFSGLCEAFKYALKFDELSHEDWLHAALSLGGRRLIYSYGCLHGVQVLEDDGDDIEDELRNQPFYEKVYRYYKGTYLLHETHSEENAFFPRIASSRKRSSKKSSKTSYSLINEHVKQWVDMLNNNIPF